MTIPNSVKLPNLRTLHLKLHEPGWTFKESNEKDKAVLEGFDAIQAEFAQLDEKWVFYASPLFETLADFRADTK